MKTTTIHALLALLTGAIATAQPPQGRGPQGGPEGNRPPAPLVGALDADQDKVISAEEIVTSAAALAALDQDGDGALSREEIRPERAEGKGPKAEGRGPRGEGKGPKGPRAEGEEGAGGPPRGRGADRPEGPPRGEGAEGRPEHPPVPPLFGALDSDQDGVLSAAEISAAPASLATLDQNADGQLTPNEFIGKGQRRKGGSQRPGKQ